MSTKSKHVVIVGGGIIGTSTAYHLLQAGAKVTVLEAATIAKATSGAGAGFVAHWSAGMIPMGAEGRDLQQYGLDFYGQLSRLGQEIGYRPNGTLIMALHEEGRETHLRAILESPYAPKEMQDLTGAEVGEKMKGLVDGSKVHSAAYNPLGIQLDTSLTLKLLVGEVARLGGDYREMTKVLGIHDHASGVTIETDQGKVEADGVILAAGAWNDVFAADLGCHLPMLKLLATRITTQSCGLPSDLPTIQCRDLGLWLRETFGAIMWGTGGHYHPYYKLGQEWIEPGQPKLEELALKMFREDTPRLQEIFPTLRGTEVAAWAQGLPCYTPDRNLYLGPVPGTTNVILAGGDNESGVTHGPGMGRVAAEMMLGQKTLIDATRFRLDRFEPGAFSTEAEVEAALAKKPIFASTQAH
ncbi:FAD-binding oxidoreductase [Xinfangfangia sp. CPCC 101601]|uniref:FAD-binding oxidoreductase n=1 Tax=Pseudogemmobacter lacusdianii TaxID=3069608 RepID=A0ABU0W1J3_9RHOB|nr:FAD-binding oxidoreductase [Xinfangfangia sp. CPCC 101601]MDQ2067878.1 FAD-binding oxidoreductase [Xinfangfangia sp. CPCC 101601]